MLITKLASYFYQEYLLILKNILNHEPFPESWKSGTKGNVLLLPGLYENAHFFIQIGNELNAVGFRVLQIDNLTTQSTSVNQYCDAVKQFISINQLDRVILLGHSKGGLIAKSLLIDPSFSKKVLTTICIATPFGGSWLSFVVPHGQELTPSSSLIKQLKSNKQINHQIFNLYPTIDNHVLPNQSLLLEEGNNYQVDVVGHTRILEDKQTLSYIKNILRDAATVE